MSAINDELEKLYQDKSKAVRNSEGYRKLWLYIGKVLEKVGEKYPRFRSINVNCLETSKSAGLTTETNRFVIFNIKGSVKDIPEFPGFARFHVDSSVLGEWKNCVNRKGYLEPRKLSSKYKKYIKWALKETELDFAVDMLIDIKVRGGGAEAITITGSYSPFMWTLNSSSYKEVKWDLNLLIGCEGLAPTKLAPWLSRSAAGINIWPTFETVTEIRNTIGFGLVAANMLAEDSNVCKTASDLHIMWRYSVFRAETCILRHCQDELIHNKLLVILKAVRLYEIPEGSESTPLTSYHMKTILLHEAHDYPNPDSWKQDKLGERYVSAMERLVKSIDEKKHSISFF